MISACQQCRELLPLSAAKSIRATAGASLMAAPLPRMTRGMASSANAISRVATPSIRYAGHVGDARSDGYYYAILGGSLRAICAPSGSLSLGDCAIDRRRPAACRVRQSPLRFGFSIGAYLCAWIEDIRPLPNDILTGAESDWRPPTFMLRLSMLRYITISIAGAPIAAFELYHSRWRRRCCRHFRLFTVPRRRASFSDMSAARCDERDA